MELFVGQTMCMPVFTHKPAIQVVFQAPSIAENP